MGHGWVDVGWRVYIYICIPCPRRTIGRCALGGMGGSCLVIDDGDGDGDAAARDI